MNCTIRQKRILLYLLNNEGCSLIDLSKGIDVSKRTIQRELDVLESFYPIERKRGHISIHLNEIEKGNLRRSLKQEREIDTSDIEQRRKSLLLELLRDHQAHKMVYFADKFQVSEGTVASDMEVLAPWLEKNYLQLVKKPGYGVCVKGKESDFREAMRRFINENYKNRSSKDLLVDAVFDNHQEGIFDLLNRENIYRIDSLLKDMHNPRLEQLEDNAYIGLLFHIAISLERIKRKEFIDSKQSMQVDEKDDDYQLAKEIVSKLEIVFQLQIPQIEILYLMMHIQGSKLQYNKISMQKDEQIRSLVEKMADVFDPACSEELKNDSVFVEGLMVHLKPVLVRLKNHMNIFNPLWDQIKREYPTIYQKTKRASQVLEEEYQCEVTPEEIGYLAMHFGAATERMQQASRYCRKVNIGVVCASGFGLARLMTAKLDRYLHLKANLIPLSKQDLDREDIDFYISSMDLEGYPYDILTISPLLQEEDLKQIQTKIESYAHIRKEQKNNDFHQQLENISQITKDIQTMLQAFSYYEVSSYIGFVDLVYDLLEKEKVPMRDLDSIAQVLFEREQLYSQILPDLKIALLHGKSDRIDTPIFCMARPYQRQTFTDPYFKKIRTVLLMLIPMQKTKEYSELFGQISTSLVEQEEVLNQVLYGSREEVEKHFEDILQNYYLKQLKKTL